MNTLKDKTPDELGMEEVTLVHTRVITQKEVLDHLRNKYGYVWNYESIHAVWVFDDDSPFANWLRERGHVFKYHNNPMRKADLVVLIGCM